MRSFLVLLGTYLLVYFVAPGLVGAVVWSLPIERPERYGGLGFLAMIAAYAWLRRVFGNRVPQV